MPSPRRAADTDKGNLAGAFWMIGAGLCFALMTALIRPAAQELHTFQLVFLRNLIGLLLLVPWLARDVDLRVWRSPNRYLHVARATLFTLAMWCWFTGIPLLPIVDAVALNFTAPIFVTCLAALILAERVRARRWSAVAAGFIGVLVVLRPGFVEIGPGQLLILADALLWAGAIILVRIMARKEPAQTIVCYMFLLVLPLSFIPALLVWSWPSTTGWLLVIGLAVISTAGHLCATQALVRAEVSSVMQYDYLRLLWFALIGWVAFGEVPDKWTLLGAAVIAGAALYILRREVKLTETV